MIAIIAIIVWSTPWLYGVYIFKSPNDFALKSVCFMMALFPWLWLGCGFLLFLLGMKE